MVVLALIMLSMAFFQVRPLIRRQEWRELAAFGTLWLLAFLWGELIMAGVHLPKPGLAIITFFEGWWK